MNSRLAFASPLPSQWIFLMGYRWPRVWPSGLNCLPEQCGLDWPHMNAEPVGCQYQQGPLKMACLFGLSLLPMREFAHENKVDLY